VFGGAAARTHKNDLGGVPAAAMTFAAGD